MNNWIFPIAGFGLRTNKLGEYKPFIEINGYKIIEHCIHNLNIDKENDRLYFITTKYFNSKFQVSEFLSTMFFGYNINVIILNETPIKGQAFTVLESLIYIDNEEQCIIINSDQIIMFDVQKFEYAGMGIYFDTKFEACYVNISDNKITKFKERDQISNYVVGGSFVCNSRSLLEKAIRWGINNKNLYYKGELHLGPCFNYFIENSKNVVPFPVIVIDFGNADLIKKNLNFVSKLRY